MVRRDQKYHERLHKLLSELLSIIWQTCLVQISDRSPVKIDHRSHLVGLRSECAQIPAAQPMLRLARNIVSDLNHVFKQ